ncbi:MAG: helix-turn-helix domain-containing protein [Candidatus Dormibacteria bacterium]
MAREESSASSEPEETASRLVRAVEWICHTLWLAERREPELVRLQERRGSMGYPHYIVSRGGLVPDERWVDCLYVLPEALVDHLRRRCLDLEPPAYVEASLDAGAQALARLLPEVEAAGLVALARSANPSGELATAWRGLDPGPQPQRRLLWAAMILRESRAHVHYRAAAALGLQPVELLVWTALWNGTGTAHVGRLFRWSEDELQAGLEALRRRGWVGESGALTEGGAAERDRLEQRTGHHTEELLGEGPNPDLERLLAQIPAEA